MFVDRIIDGIKEYEGFNFIGIFIYRFYIESVSV